MFKVKSVSKSADRTERKLTLSESRAAKVLKKIPKRLRGEFPCYMVNTLDSTIEKQNDYKACPVCGSAYEQRHGNFEFGHMSYDDYGSLQTRWCQNPAAVPRGYSYYATRMPIY